MEVIIVDDLFLNSLLSITPYRSPNLQFEDE
ncbi:hypothetical protein Pedsa_3526 [Pseudopedobacter saltans DSM 12145]|uniref:Uncharacterized protein n=1 Tax=Pseudopedobacter saltans (strain ATCC 51119 / DSM 12145 / JCM 21818 / CCUG 39354 / LMG 10337 / NBRC 100064 / NCIMB 13643) TaxID=762903 RepID=F0SEY8_PSESL|nr:hypothetical protein Pedsa_3526 [Pseudopedobacter saltans DSM 12145]